MDKRITDLLRAYPDKDTYVIKLSFNGDIFDGYVLYHYLLGEIMGSDGPIEKVLFAKSIRYIMMYVDVLGVKEKLDDLEDWLEAMSEERE